MDAGSDPKNPKLTIVDRLLRADAKSKVHKFSENGKESTLTDLELQMKEIENGPVLTRFGDRAKSGLPVGVSAKTVVEEEKAKVIAHVEKFSEEFRTMDMTAEEVARAFESKRKQDPTLTAEKYLNIEAA